jgi:surface polysaccharide O-acyltransferase-like enzyme
METPNFSIETHRLFFLDWLRVIAVVILVFYHVGMLYVTWDYHVKSPFASRAMEPWMMMTGPWRMSLLFMVSGAATACMLKAGASNGLMRQRSRQLLLPLLSGVLLIVPPQSYFEVVQKFNYSGGYGDFLALYFGHFNGFCDKGNCLILPTWNHLWFLPYLWLYTLLLWLAANRWPNTLVNLGRFSHLALAGARLIVLPIAFLLLTRLALANRFPETHALWGDWFNHLQYFALFLCGASFAMSPTLWPRLASWRWAGLVLAVIAWAVLEGTHPRGMGRHAVVAVVQWCALVSAFGFAYCLLNVDNAWRARLTEAVFPMYIFHQTYLIALSQWLRPLQWPPQWEGPTLVAVTLLLSYASYALVRRVGVLRVWFGLRPRP